jgi:hypothetical protein
MIEGRANLGRESLFGATYAAFVTKDDERPERDVYALHVRTNKWKYIHYLQDVRQDLNGSYFRIQSICTDYLTRDRGDEELFDLETDPYELSNLAAVEEHRALICRLRQSVFEWWQATSGGEL